MKDNSKNENNFDAFPFIKKLCSRFHRTAKQLTDRYDKSETLDLRYEDDVRHLFHGVLTLFFDNIKDDEWTPAYSGKSSRKALVLRDHRIVIDIKLVRKDLGAEEVATQLREDIARYKHRPECNMLICFVYDPEGQIADPAGTEKDLSTDQDGFRVRVIVAPRRY
ncbi:MAG: hypothetical protein ABIH23_15305 [bacterium]